MRRLSSAIALVAASTLLLIGCASTATADETNRAACKQFIQAYDHAKAGLQSASDDESAGLILLDYLADVYDIGMATDTDLGTHLVNRTRAARDALKDGTFQDQLANIDDSQGYVDKVCSSLGFDMPSD